MYANFSLDKKCVLLIFLLTNIFVKAQLIEKRTYTIVAPSFNQQHHRPTVGTPLLDGGFCIGGEVDYIIGVGGPQTLTSEKTFVLKIDSNYNISWIDTSALMEDDSYASHEVNSVFQTNDSGIIFDQTHEYSIVRNMTKNDINGNRLWEINFYDTINQANMHIEHGEIVNDTILYPGTKYYGLRHDPYIIITTSQGNSAIYIDSSALGCTSEFGVEIVKDFNGHLYCVLSNENLNTIVHEIKPDASIISTYQIPYSNFNSDSRVVSISSNRIMSYYPSTTRPQYFYNVNENTIDSTSLNSYLLSAGSAMNGNILMITLFNSGLPGSSILPDGRNFIEIDSIGNPVWGYSFGSLNDSDQISFVKQINNTDYVLLGTFYSSTSSVYPVLFEKIRRPQFNQTLNINSSYICTDDSILISAPSGYSYRWNTGDTTQSIFAKSAGEYFALLFDISGFFVASTRAIISDPIAPNIGSDTLICTAQSLTLDAGSGYVSYLWNDASTSQTLSVNDTTSGQIMNSYSVIVTDTNGCVLSDSIIVTIDVCNSIYESSAGEIFKVYPNPVMNVLNIQNISNLNSEIRIFNLLGKCLLTKMIKSNQNELQLDVSSIQAGIYSIEFLSENNSRYRISKLCLIK